MSDIRARLWEPDDAELAQRITDVVARAPLKLWELAEQFLGVTRGRRRDQYAEELDRVVLRNPFAFMFTPGRDGIDRVKLRPEPGPITVSNRLQAMRHFARVAPRPEPYARTWLKSRPGWYWSCGDPLAESDAIGRCHPCDVAATAWRQEQRKSLSAPAQKRAAERRKKRSGLLCGKLRNSARRSVSRCECRWV